MSEQFCLRWNNHQSTLISVFENLLESGSLIDCTLCAEGQLLKAHKVVLSACSPTFESMLCIQEDKHPIIFLKDVRFIELKAMIDYMYKGEVNILQDQLDSFLKTAAALQIKGLTDQGGGGGDEPPAKKGPGRKTGMSDVAPESPLVGNAPLREGSMSPTRRRRRLPRRPSSAEDASADNSSCDIPPPATAPNVLPASTPNPLPASDSSPAPRLSVKKTEPLDPPLITPKQEMLDEPAEDIEDLTLDDDDDYNDAMSDMSKPGTSFGAMAPGNTSQDFSQWQQMMGAADRSGQDEVFMAAQEAINNQSNTQGSSNKAQESDQSVAASKDKAAACLESTATSDNSTNLPRKPKSTQDGNCASNQSGLKSPEYQSPGSMSAEDTLALFQSLGVARVTTAGEEEEPGKLTKEAANKQLGEESVVSEEVMFDMEITATEEVAKDETKPIRAIRLGYPCEVCTYASTNLSGIKRHLLVKHGILNDVSLKKSDISITVVKAKPEESSKNPKMANIVGLSDEAEPESAGADLDVSSTATAAADQAHHKASKAREVSGTLISLSSSKFSNASIELIESESESVLKLPVSCIASLNDKDAMQLLKSIRQATKAHAPQTAESIETEEPEISAEQEDLAEPIHSDYSSDAEPEAQPTPGSSKSENDDECDICNYRSPYATSMRRHMLVKHGLVQDITRSPAKRAPKKRPASDSKKPKKKPKMNAKPPVKKLPTGRQILVMEKKMVRLEK